MRTVPRSRMAQHGLRACRELAFESTVPADCAADIDLDTPSPSSASPLSPLSVLVVVPLCIKDEKDEK